MRHIYYTAAMGVRVEARGLGARHGARAVLEDVAFAVREREVLAIVGPSGCGKTTRLRCLDGLHRPFVGEVLVDGEPMSGPRAGVAMVFQQFGLFPWKTVLENAAYGLSVAGASRAEIAARVPAYLRLVGLEGFEGHYPHQLSAGMQQRCGLARALAVEPRALLLDEPFGSVDPQTRALLQLELLRIWESRPVTMILVTHSIDEALLLADRVAVMKGRPATISEIVPVDLPRPRGRRTLSLPRFAELRERLWDALADDARAAELQPRGRAR